MQNSKVVICLVLRDRFSMFRRCLESVLTHTEISCPILIISGGTDELTKRYLRDAQRRIEPLRLVFVDHLLRQSEARNIAFASTCERYVVLLENDTIMHKNWLSPLLSCMREEGAAAVMPLILDYWIGGIHAAGGFFQETRVGNETVFRNRIWIGNDRFQPGPLQRSRIDYPETHCMLVDREYLADADLFDDVEPFDADFGLTLRQRALSALVEPQSVGTYIAPPPFAPSDIELFKFRWDRAMWKERNRRFMRKWQVRYDPYPKLVSYRRQQLKLGPAYWFANQFNVSIVNWSLTAFKNCRGMLRSLGGQA